jgi:zinc/manganese transport system substrate-binding protein
MLDADLLVVNGAGFEEGMADVIEQAADAGTPVFSFADHVDLLTLGDGDEPDPHLFTDPSRVATAVDALGPQVAELDGADATAVASSTAGYVDELEELDASIEEQLAVVPASRRTLVTNHEVLGYFADRYGFEVIGAVVPSLTTRAAPSAADLTALADTVRDRGVPAVFAETTQSAELADALADEVGGRIEVVELYTESLGEPGSGAESYIGMMETNAARIAEALR